VAALNSSVNLRRLRRCFVDFPSAMSDTVSAFHYVSTEPDQAHFTKARN
jgi:hypothetical protein